MTVFVNMPSLEPAVPDIREVISAYDVLYYAEDTRHKLYNIYKLFCTLHIYYLLMNLYSDIYRRC